MADKSFWGCEHAAFADRYRIIAVDLAGHGESGCNRPQWGIVPFARDVLAAITAERVTHSITIGNSLGGPVAIEAAVLLGDAAKGVIGVDTFQDMGRASIRTGRKLRLSPGAATRKARWTACYACYAIPMPSPSSSPVCETV